MKTIVSLLILLTLFSVSTFAADSPRQKTILMGKSWELKGVMFRMAALSQAAVGIAQYIYGTWDLGNRKLSLQVIQ